jgi:guanosine-3',5'-bis(diphosphate) 3'-pyrophosphohydrolase
VKVFDSWGSWPEAEPALRERLPSDVVDGLARAYHFAAEWHGDQVRPAGEPYVEHLLQALEVAVEVAGATSAEVLTATLLHDVVEDTACTIERVRDEFGPEVAELVAWVTKPEPGPGDDPQEFRRRYLDSFDDAPADVLVVKLSDRYSNVQRLDTHPRPVKQAGYYAETVRWFLPLAERSPRFAPLFAQWRDRFGYLAAAGS